MGRSAESPDESGSGEDEDEPKGTTDAVRDTRIEQARRSAARRLGLPESARWREIYAEEDLQERITVARRLGFDEEYIEHVTWRNIVTALLGLQGTAPLEAIIEKIQEVVKQNDTSS